MLQECILKDIFYAYARYTDPAKWLVKLAVRRPGVDLSLQ
jgi:hypothetical protein